MSLGEYNYYYVLSYYSFLGRLPEEGPSFEYIISDDGNTKVDFGDESLGKKKYVKKVKENRKLKISRMINEQYKSFIFNQLSSMDSESSIYSTLKEEHKKLQSDSLRIPWEDSLPEEVYEIFYPLREKLERTYIANLNPIDFNRWDTRQ